MPYAPADNTRDDVQDQLRAYPGSMYPSEWSIPSFRLSTPDKPNEIAFLLGLDPNIPVQYGLRSYPGMFYPDPLLYYPSYNLNGTETQNPGDHDPDITVVSTPGSHRRYYIRDRKRYVR